MQDFSGTQTLMPSYAPILILGAAALGFGVFTLGYGRLGPTEVRLALIVLNTMIAVGLGLGFQVGGLGLTVLDLIGLAIAGVMIAALLARAARNLRVLAEQEPAGVRPLANSVEGLRHHA